MCDLNSIDSQDLKPIDVMHPAGNLESYRILYNQKQRWGYFSTQDIKELLIFQSADSVKSGTGKPPIGNIRLRGPKIFEVPHCAFDNPSELP